MKWGVFPLRENGDIVEVHIIPCDGDGFISPRHSAERACACDPVVEVFDDGCPPIVIHELEQ